MSRPRPIIRILKAHAVVEGAGVHLHRAIGFDASRTIVAWQGPIVMNTQEELETAFSELESNTFVKTAKGSPPRSRPDR